MKHPLSILSLFFFLTFLISGCIGGHDPDLETPDIDDAGMSHGYNLTELGCFVYRPWQYDLRSTNDSLYNVRVISNDGEMYSKWSKYTLEEAELVFQLYKDKTLRYWLKKDYIHSPIDTTSDGGIIKHGVPIDLTNIKSIYKGSWTFDTNDSTFKFNFSDSRMLLPDIEGKYIDLGSTTMSYQVKTFFDSTVNGSVMNLKRVSTKSFIH